MRKMAERLCMSDNKLNFLRKDFAPSPTMMIKRHENHTVRIDLRLIGNGKVTQNPIKKDSIGSDGEIGISDYDTNASSCFESPCKS